MKLRKKKRRSSVNQSLENFVLDKIKKLMLTKIFILEISRKNLIIQR